MKKKSHIIHTSVILMNDHHQSTQYMYIITNYFILIMCYDHLHEHFLIFTLSTVLNADG